MVEEKSREVNKRLSSALKKLLELHEKENKKSAADSDKRIWGGGWCIMSY